MNISESVIRRLAKLDATGSESLAEAREFWRLFDELVVSITKPGPERDDVYDRITAERDVYDRITAERIRMRVNTSASPR